jgi:V/A-type H+-transporting ATPase subunit A
LVAYIHIGGDKSLKAEVIRIRGDNVEVQVFEATKGMKIGDGVDFTALLLTAELGPGLLGKVYDGLQNPLNELAEEYGFFLERGVYFDALKKSPGISSSRPDISLIACAHREVLSASNKTLSPICL